MRLHSLKSTPRMWVVEDQATLYTPRMQLVIHKGI